MRSYRYMSHLWHLAFSHAIHGFPRAPNPVRICDTFCTSATGTTFRIEQGYAILPLFAAFAAPGLLTRHSRIPAGTQSCAYLRSILHFRLVHFHFRNLRPSNLMHICYTFFRRSLSDQFEDNFLGGFLPWNDFERRVVHTFPKIPPGRLQRLAATFGFARNNLLFWKTIHSVIGLTPTPFSSAPHVSRARGIWAPLPFSGVGGSGRRPLESADPEGGLGEVVDGRGPLVWLEVKFTKL